MVVLVQAPWQVRSADGRMVGPGGRALLTSREALRLASQGIVTILDHPSR